VESLSRWRLKSHLLLTLAATFDPANGTDLRMFREAAPTFLGFTARLDRSDDSR